MNQLRGKRRKRSGDVCGGCRSKCEWAATMLRGQGVREDVLLPALKVGAAVNISAALHRDLSEAELSVLSMRASAMMALTRSFFFFLSMRASAIMALTRSFFFRFFFCSGVTQLLTPFQAEHARGVADARRRRQHAAQVRSKGQVRGSGLGSRARA